MLSLAYYPDYFGFLAWLALARPFMIISQLKGKEAFRATYYFSFFFIMFSIYWLAIVTPPGMVAAVFLVALYYAIILYAFNRVFNIKKIYGIILLPFLWVGLEYFRTISEFAFPWSDLGYTQSYYLYIVQIASITSVHGISFLIVVVNILFWQVLRKDLLAERRLTAGYVALGIIIGLIGYGWIELPKYPLPGKDIEVAILQGSISIQEKWKKDNADFSYHRYDSLAQTVSDSNTILYIWPETSAPAYVSHDPSARLKIGRIARKTNSYHLVGGLGAGISDGKQRYYNSCYQFNPQGQIDKQYNKAKLVPFSEHVPYQDVLFFLEKAQLRKIFSFIDNYSIQWWSDFYPGKGMELFHTPEYDYVTLICFESTFPEFSRQAINEGAAFLVGITNDTWFGRSVGIHQHSRIFIMRAVENRSWGVRCANSGLSYLVDGYGRIRDELELYQPAVLRGKINRVDERTVFTKYGDIIGLSSFLITLSIIGILFIQWIIRKLFFRSS